VFWRNLLPQSSEETLVTTLIIIQRHIIDVHNLKLLNPVCFSNFVYEMTTVSFLGVLQSPFHIHFVLHVQHMSCHLTLFYLPSLIISAFDWLLELKCNTFMCITCINSEI
jgi:hypothetical protein